MTFMSDLPLKAAGAAINESSDSEIYRVTAGEDSVVVFRERRPRRIAFRLSRGDRPKTAGVFLHQAERKTVNSPVKKIARASVLEGQL
jgi:hypothetical protein